MRPHDKTHDHNIPPLLFCQTQPNSAPTRQCVFQHTVHNQTGHQRTALQAVLCTQTVQCTCLEASAVALTASRREADSLALELDSSISIARSVSACMEVEGHIRKEL